MIARWTLTCLVLFLATSPALAQDPPFELRRYATAGGELLSSAAGDVDGDGLPDLLVPGFRTLELRRGRPGRRFEPPRPWLTIPGTPRLVETGDLDDDGDLDLAVVTGTELVVYLGAGDGSFTESYRSPISIDPRDIAITDIDRDRIPDIVVLCFDVANVLPFLGDGAGGFTLSGSYGTGLAFGFHIADLEGDGDLDIGLALGHGGFAILTGDGRGGFSEGPARSVGASRVATGIALLEGFVVVAHFFNQDLSSLSLYRPDGQWVSTRSTTHLFGHLTLLDFDGDGSDDVLLDDSGFEVQLLEDDGGSIRFGNTVRLTDAVDSNGHRITDVDRDGDPDILFFGRNEIGIAYDRRFTHLRARTGTVNAGAGQVHNVLFVNGSPGTGPERRVEYPIPRQPFAIDIIAPATAPTSSPVPYALYAWTTPPSPDTVRDLPFGIGTTCLPVPLIGGSPAPVEIWNNAGRRGSLGTPTRTSRGAPEVIVDLPEGPSRVGSVFLQGLIYDPGSAADVQASVTNGIWAVPVLQ